MSRLNGYTLIWRSLTFFRTMHLALAGGIAAATAVIVGALVVGDSVRGSLRALVIERLANVECAMFSRNFFQQELIAPLNQEAEKLDAQVTPIIVLQSASIERQSGEEFARAGHVQVFGVTEDFWQHASDEPVVREIAKLEVDQIVLNQSLAQELGAKVGDEITLRLPTVAAIPADSPLGRRDDTSLGLPRQKIVSILPDSGVGALSLRIGQSLPRNAYLSIATLQDILNAKDKANGALVFSSGAKRPTSMLAAERLCTLLSDKFRPQLADYGIQLKRHRRVFPDPTIGEKTTGGEPKTVYDYYQLSSDQLVLDDRTSDTLRNALGPHSNRTMTYLANFISVAGPSGSALEVPYSIVVGVEDNSPIPLEAHTTERPSEIRRRVCWVNSWLADRLGVQAGAMLRVHYFQPETVDGREVETSVELFVMGIVPVKEPIKKFEKNDPAVFDICPTEFNDPNLTPQVPGVTDQDSINDWDLPFDLIDEKILKEDDLYWENHRLTPKLFMPLSTADSLFGSRFGRATAIRINADQVHDQAELVQIATEAMFTIKSAFGMHFLPLRQQQISAASGTTPFDGLFLSLSFFVIVSAVLLVALLFRLGIEQRAEQWGLMLAQGFSHGQVRRYLLVEAAPIVLVGSILGILLGLAYARLMIVGLQTWWLGAITVPFLRFGWSFTSLSIGALIGAATSLTAIYWCLRKLRNLQALHLLRGQWVDTEVASREIGRLAMSLCGICCIGALGLILFGSGQSGMVRAGCFFGSGMLLLTAGLLGMREWFSFPRMGRDVQNAVGGLRQVAWLAICRNPLRSILSVGLLSVASFLIASMSVFQITPSSNGYGGFDLIGEMSLPLFENIGSGKVRAETLGDDEGVLKKTTIVALRSRPGDDASCNNLFKPDQPTVLGVPPAFERQQSSMPPSQAFQWAARIPDESLPWKHLAVIAPGTAEAPIPVVIDQNTAMWSLKQGASIGAVSRFEFDSQVLYFKTVGLLAGSVLQGKLLIGEQNFHIAFPKINGYRYYLINSFGQNQQEIIKTLESGWSDQGMDVVSSKEVLSRLLAVQNTYISAFQSLGALGLLLGTIGLAIVQVRSVLERKRELALMRAVGFSGMQISRLLLLETTILLAGGIWVGVLSALIAIVPYVLETGPQTTVVQPLVMLGVVFLIGMLASLYAIRTALVQNVLAGLRSA